MTDPGRSGLKSHNTTLETLIIIRSFSFNNDRGIANIRIETYRCMRIDANEQQANDRCKQGRNFVTHDKLDLVNEFDSKSSRKYTFFK